MSPGPRREAPSSRMPIRARSTYLQVPCPWQINSAGLARRVDERHRDECDWIASGVFSDRRATCGKPNRWSRAERLRVPSISHCAKNDPVTP